MDQEEVGGRGRGSPVGNNTKEGRDCKSVAEMCPRYTVPPEGALREGGREGAAREGGREQASERARELSLGGKHVREAGKQTGKGCHHAWRIATSTNDLSSVSCVRAVGGV